MNAAQRSAWNLGLWQGVVTITIGHIITDVIDAQWWLSLLIFLGVGVISGLLTSRLARRFLDRDNGTSGGYYVPPVGEPRKP